MHVSQHDLSGYDTVEVKRLVLALTDAIDRLEGREAEPDAEGQTRSAPPGAGTSSALLHDFARALVRALQERSREFAVMALSMNEDGEAGELVAEGYDTAAEIDAEGDGWQV